MIDPWNLIGWAILAVAAIWIILAPIALVVAIRRQRAAALRIEQMRANIHRGARR